MRLIRRVTASEHCRFARTWARLVLLILTGSGQATFTGTERGYRITEVIVENAEPRFPGGSDYRQCTLLELLISSLLLGEPADVLRRRLYGTGPGDNPARRMV